MAIPRQLENYIQNLTSSKITERRKSAEPFLLFLKNQETIDCLNNDPKWWDTLLSSAQKFVWKEAEKAVEDHRKKGAPLDKFPHGRLFSEVVRLIVKEATYFDAELLIRIISDFLNDNLVNKCMLAYITNILQQIMLPNGFLRSRLQSDDWAELFDKLKAHHSNLLSDKEFGGIKTLSLLIRYGPHHSFPVDLLREQFGFVTKLCQSITSNSAEPLKEAVLDIVYYFCLHTAKDNRMACCKLGEEVFNNLIILYEKNTRPSKIKIQLINFFLLQITLHNPDGVSKGHPVAYAYNWEHWTNCIVSMYDVIEDEILRYLKSQNKNNTIFLIDSNGHKYILPELVNLFVETFKQINVNDRIYKNTDEDGHKRQKLESVSDKLIRCIQESQDWSWIHLTSALLRKYPDIIDCDNFVKLLEVFSKLQVESKDVYTVHHIYDCLCAMESLEKIKKVPIEQTQPLWDVITECAFRAFGLNTQDESIHRLLQHLIVRNNNIQADVFLQTYTSGVLKVNDPNIQTLDVAYRYMDLPGDSPSKTNLFKWILHEQHLEILPLNSTARVVASLMLKQWPIRRDTPTECGDEIYNDITDIYLKTFAFNHGLHDKSEGTRRIDDSSEENDCILDNDYIQFVIEEIITHIKNLLRDNNHPKDIVCMTRFLKNMLVNMLEFEIVSEQNLEDNSLYRLLTHLFDELDRSFGTAFQRVNESNVDTLIQFMHDLGKIFETNGCRQAIAFVKIIRANVPINLLKNIMQILDIPKEKHCASITALTPKMTVRIEAMKTLAKYCFVPQTGIFLTQYQLLEILLSKDLKFRYEDDYEVAIAMLDTFTTTKPLDVSDDLLTLLLTLIKNVCSVRYKYYTTAVKVLDLFYELYPYVANSVDENKSFAMSLLHPFYENQKHYGPQVAVKLINCFGKLYELDTDCTFTYFDDREVVLIIPEFLCSDYQEIRFAAVRNIANFFRISSKLKVGKYLDLQKRMFDQIYAMSIKVFEVKGDITDERRVDETVTRTASVLYTFSSIITTNNFWLEEALFSMLKLVHKKQLSSLPNILELIAKDLHFAGTVEFLEHHLEVLLTKWTEEYHLKNFPFSLLGCNTFEFFNKYLDAVIPFVIRADCVEDLMIDHAELTAKAIATKTFANLFSKGLLEELPSLSEESLARNPLMTFLYQNFEAQEISDLLKGNLDEIVLLILFNINDNNHFEELYGEKINITKFNMKGISVKHFFICLKFIESLLSEELPVIGYMLKIFPNKIQNLTMQLKIQIQKAFASEDKLRHFHQYMIIINEIITNFDYVKVPDYFIRDSIYTLLNFIEEFGKYCELSCGAAKYLDTFLRLNLKRNCHKITDYFTDIINTLRNVPTDEGKLNRTCVDIITLLIVEHRADFVEVISKLDPFPSTMCIQKIKDVHSVVKYGEEQLTLNDEIYQFLNIGTSARNLNQTARLEGLKRLRNVLSTQKNQLNSMYEMLKKTKRFSEDSEHSLLHQLVCSLIKLSSSELIEVKIEALKCLGELGPADLVLLVLEAEKNLTYTNWSPLELFFGKILSVLSDYLGNPDVRLITPTSEALFSILNTREGKKVATSENDFGYGNLKNVYFYPFYIQKHPTSTLSVNVSDFVKLIDSEMLWCPSTDTEHDKWITTLVCVLLQVFKNHNCFIKLQSICELKPDFCEIILPPLIYLLLTLQNKKLSEIVIFRINYFFEQHWNLVIGNGTSTNKFIALDRKSVECMLQIVHFYRINKRNTKLKVGLGDLQLDYLKVAQAAQYCSAHFMAILYVDIWCRRKISSFDHQDQSNTILDVIYEVEAPEVGLAVQNILRTAYKEIGDADALKGCDSAIILNPQLRVEYYKESGMRDQVVRFFDIQMSQGNQNCLQPLMGSLKEASFYQLPLLFANDSETPQYECLWRLGKWNHNETKRREKSSLTADENLHKYKYFALKALTEGDMVTVSKNIEKARHDIAFNLKLLRMESSKKLYSVLSHLQSLCEIESVAAADDLDEFQNILLKWKSQDSLSVSDFTYSEPIKAQRIILFDSFCRAKKLTHGAEAFKLQLILDLSKWSRLEGRNEIALRSLAMMQTLTNLSVNEKAQVQLEDAQLCWNFGNQMAARNILKVVYNDENVDPGSRALALKLCGQWMIETYSENRQSIINNYLMKSLSIMQSKKEYSSILDTYDLLAKFSDQQYKQIVEHMSSEFFQRKVQHIERAKETVRQMKEKRLLTHDEKRAILVQQKHCHMDEKEVDNIKQERNDLLCFALKYYIYHLLHSDGDWRMFRVIGLFLENRSNFEIQDLINQELTKIPSYKFLNILPQIIPHIAESNTDDFFAKHMTHIVERCAKDHPHHTLPLLLALANSNKDQIYASTKTSCPNNDVRTMNAVALLNKLKQDKCLKDIIKHLEKLSDALIELAYFKDLPGRENNKNMNIPKDLKISKIRNFSCITVPTDSIGIRKNGKYDNIIGIHSFGPHFRLVGGVNLPKRIVCIGTDGIERLQLVKGEDDLRQDAVMQQVFTIMNGLLAINKDTQNLSIKTYKIVPLSKRSGILLWAENTITFGSYLVGDDKATTGAHEKYRPMDQRAQACRSMILKAAKESFSKRHQVYKEICNNFKPVFHKFFEDFFVHPIVWYERRQAYIRSVATTSMCGYILGIGDRHVSNILIDKTTAEIIHIDFGIAFEQGKVLPTPETVPFRLTRDIVDGMGVSGVEGSFRRACEKTMKVLRDNSSTITTIVEVLLYDPLYAWTVTQAEANKRQKNFSDDSTDELDNTTHYGGETSTNSVNMTAERALLRLQAKLQGVEDGNPTSIEHQVSLLIQQAMDPANLCRLFHGWQAYL